MILRGRREISKLYTVYKFNPPFQAHLINFSFVSFLGYNLYQAQIAYSTYSIEKNPYPISGANIIYIEYASDKGDKTEEWLAVYHSTHYFMLDKISCNWVNRNMNFRRIPHIGRIFYIYIKCVQKGGQTLFLIKKSLN